MYLYVNFQNPNEEEKRFVLQVSAKHLCGLLTRMNQVNAAKTSSPILLHRETSRWEHGCHQRSLYPVIQNPNHDLPREWYLRDRRKIASRMSLFESTHWSTERFRMHQSLVQTWESYVVARVIPRDSAIDLPQNQEIFTSPARAVRRRQVIYLMIFCLCLSAAGAIFTLVVLEPSQARLASITSGGFRAVLLAISSALLITDIYVAATGVFQIIRIGLTDSQLAPQTCWDTYRGAIMDIIEGCVVFPVFLLNTINARSQYYGSQNAPDYITQVATIVLSLVWIAIWLSSGQHVRGENANQESTTIQSRGNHYHVGAGEANRREFLEEPPDTFESSTRSDFLNWRSLLW